MADTAETKATETQQAEENKTEQTETKEQKEEKKTEQVDTEGIKKSAIAEMLKNLGIESEESLQTIVTKHNEEEQSKMSDLEKTDKALKKTQKELITVTKERDIAQAKLSALMLGANKDMVDDLVIVATAKVTERKDIEKVMQEIKDSPSGKAYFNLETEETKNTTVTSVRKTGAVTKTNKSEEGEPETLAERLYRRNHPVKRNN